MSPKCVLLTGASGLVASAAIDLLVQDPYIQVIALSRTPERIRSHPQIKAIRADITESDLGLPADISCDLQRNVGDVIHCAADVRFSLPIEQARLVNTQGTRNLLDWSAGCPNLSRFIHVSSVFVGGTLEGHLFEERLPNSRRYINTYQQSKHEAEVAVFDAMKRIPAMIVRLSSIIGNSDGRVSQFNYFHQLIRMIPRSPLPVIPGNPESLVDLIPCDWAAPALCRLTNGGFQEGEVIHLCSGPDRSMRADEIVRRTFELFKSHPRFATSGSIQQPDLVPLREFDRFAATLSERRNGSVVEFLRVLRQFLPQMAVRQSFDTTKAQELVSPPPRADSYYDKVVRYCLDTDWGRTA